MTDEPTTKLSFRLNTAVHTALAEEAKINGMETMAYIQQILARHAVKSGYMDPDEAEKIKATDEIIGLAVKKAQELYAQNLFSEDFVLTVFQHLMKDTTFRPKYERTIGGDAYAIGLPGKSPLNMYLGWYIKNAVGAVPQMSKDRKPVRVQVKNEPIQSYTRLQPAATGATTFS
jgi:hypothetical protein